MRRLLFLVVIILSSTYALWAQDSITTTTWEQLIPSDKLPDSIQTMHSNNNLDAVRYKGKYYVGFRTAPTHFASKKTLLYIISSTDMEEWQYEHKFWVGADMREPRFLVFRDTLFFYFFEGGKKMLKFEPKHIWSSQTIGNGQWTSKKNIGLDGYVPWRLKSHNDKVYLSAYYGVNLYKNKHSADLRLFVSEDGLHFEPISKKAQITTKGAEEGTFEFDNDGHLWGTIRLEGSGSYVVFAHRDSLDVWHHWFSRHKYDSALLFEHRGEMYVVARRHLKGEATKVEVPTKSQRTNNLLKYSFSRKCTAIYRIDKLNHSLIHLMDFPSTGDNAFPGIARIDKNSYYLLNYSSDIHKRKKNWITGQLGKTYIYATQLTFHEK